MSSEIQRGSISGIADGRTRYVGAEGPGDSPDAALIVALTGFPNRSYNSFSDHVSKLSSWKRMLVELKSIESSQDGLLIS